MIKVILGNNAGKETVFVDENSTLRSCLEAHGVDYSHATTNLDGSPIEPGGLDKTFAQYGIKESCYLYSIVKMNNA